MEKTHGQNCAVEHICNLQGGATCEVTMEPSGSIIVEVNDAFYRVTRLGRFTLLNPRTNDGA